MTKIQRQETNARMSQIVVHENTVYLAGVVADSLDGGIESQTSEVLSGIEARLKGVGSEKSRLLSAQIWLRDIDTDFGAMNKVWESWLPAGAAPTRATCQARMAHPKILVEIIVTAALAGSAN